tara:strand:+ start:2294 stop:2992 length:699 start_codon:yes stop_codon:yes gene_type:complete
MSNLVSNVIQTKLIGSPTKKAILMYMADKASDDGSGIWVSKGNMAADLEMSSRAVRVHIKDMLAMGILKVSGQKECRNGYTIDYQINLQIVSQLPSTRPPLNDVHPYHGMTFSPTPELNSGKPSKEPSKEPIILVRSIDVIIEQFKQFWDKYPRKTAKAQAQKVFARALTKIDFEPMMEKLDIFIEAHKDTKKEFIPHASTWLNQERWNDEYETENKLDTQKEVLREMLNAQ